MRGSEPAGHLGVLQAAVFSGRRLRLGYRSSGRREPSERVVRLRFGAVPAARVLLSFGGDVEVVSPPEVRADLAAVAAAVVARYART